MIGEYIERFVRFLAWLYTPEYAEPDPEPEPVYADRLTEIRGNMKGLESTLKELGIEEKEVEASLMGERSDIVVKALLDFTHEFKFGQLPRDFRELQKAIFDLRETGRNWPQFFARYTEGVPQMNERAIRMIYINFTEQMSKGGSGYLDALQYIAKRKKSSNPFLIGRTL